MTIDPAAPLAPASIDDWLAIPEEQRAELLDGRIIYQGMPGPTHGATQTALGAALHPWFVRRPGDGDRPGGWWISLEVDMLLGNFGCRPDLLGWRRARSPHLPVPNARGLVTLVPDWICEVLSTSTAAYDIGDKRAAYHRAGVAHYWIADPVNHTIAVFAHRPDGYLLVASAGRGERVALPPFDAVAIVLDDVFDPDATAPG